MYAQYNNIIFEPLSSFDAVNDDEEAIWVEHAPLTGKPILQATGLGAREMNISIRLRQEFTDIKETVADLRSILRNHTVGKLIWGNGDVEGSFVMTRMSRVIEEQDEKGNIYAVSLNIALKEFEVLDATEVKRKTARKNAAALSDKAAPVVNPKKNTPTGKQQVVKLLTDARRAMIEINKLAVFATDAYNGSASAQLILLDNALASIGVISALKGPATDNSKQFNEDIISARGYVAAVQGLLPATDYNLNSVSSATTTLSGSIDKLQVFGGVFTRQVVTRRSNQTITPFTTSS